MGAAVKKTISLPVKLAREAEALAKAEGKTLSGVIQEALRQARVGRRQQDLRGVQGFWSRKARERGLLTEEDLERYLGRGDGPTARLKPSPPPARRPRAPLRSR